MNHKNKVSVVIPLITFNDYLRETVAALLPMASVSEIIILPNQRPRVVDKLYRHNKVRIIPTGRSEPGLKRNVGVNKARREIVAFLDDDSYPDPVWLAQVLVEFERPWVAGVGGPAVTPVVDSFAQQLSGAVFETYLGGSTARNRYLPIGQASTIDDWPTVNLLVRKSAFLSVGGFDERFWPGEDTKLCLDLVSAGYKLVYRPEAIVYHHRRSDLSKHLRQVFAYAFHRGNFFKTYPATSRRVGYAVPSLFTLYLGVLLLLVLADYSFPHFAPWASWGRQITGYSWLLWPLALYGVLLVADGLLIARAHKDPFLGLMVMPLVVATHLAYGLGFLKGLLLPQPKSMQKEY